MEENVCSEITQAPTTAPTDAPYNGTNILGTTDTGAAGIGGGDEEALDIMGLLPLLLAALFFLLFLLWFLYPLITGKKANPKAAGAGAAGAIPASSTAVAAPAPVEMTATKVVTQKWKTVDTSSYIWATSGGGAAPMKTNWGELGATNAAPTLNAKTSEMDVQVEVPVEATAAEKQAAADAQAAAFRPEGASCGDKVFGCYASIAALRPERAAAKTVNI